MLADVVVPDSLLALPVWLDVLAMSANGLFGAAVARSRNVPIYGTLFAGLLVGLGGGMARDVLLGLEPVAISVWYYLPAVLLGAVVGALIFAKLVARDIGYLVAQGVTLGLLVTIGAQKALSYDAPPVSVIFLGVITASAGGIVADVMSGHSATIAKQAHWIASALVVGTTAFWLLSVYVNFWLAVVVCVLIVTALRVLSVRLDWASPRWPGEGMKPALHAQ